MTHFRKIRPVAWGSRWTFILAATGAAIGLGNIWRFPYLVAEYGGGSFLLLYLLCLFIIGVPLLLAEVAIGRHARQDPANALALASTENGLSSVWAWVGRLSIVGGLLVMSIYSVVGGLALAYVGQSALGAFDDATPLYVAKLFSLITGDATSLTLWHSLFLLLVAFISSRGVTPGLERAARVIMPILFLLLIVLLLYALNAGNAHRAVDTMLQFNPQDLSFRAIAAAMTHAFFTLSVGMGAMMVLGAYMPGTAPLGPSVALIALLDTLVALVAGLLIFALVPIGDADATSGFGLIFHAMPTALGHSEAGHVAATAFFLVIALAAWSSAIAAVEPAVAWFSARTAWPRRYDVWCVCALVWALGMGSVWSFNRWQALTWLGQSYFAWMNILTSGLLLPVAGLLLAAFVGRKVDATWQARVLGLRSPHLLTLWRASMRYLIPALILLVVAHTWGEFGRRLCEDAPLFWCASSDAPLDVGAVVPEDNRQSLPEAEVPVLSPENSNAEEPENESTY